MAKYQTTLICTGECIDAANKERLVICFRYVDENVDVHEEFIGLHECPNILANTNVARLQDIMLRLNLAAVGSAMMVEAIWQVVKVG